MSKKFLLLLPAAVLGLAAHAAIDPANFAPAVKPQDDFYHYANGTWLKTHPIPAAYSAYGAFYEIDDRNREALHTILERVAHAAQRSLVEQQVGDFYASGMDEAAANAAGKALYMETGSTGLSLTSSTLIGALVRSLLVTLNVVCVCPLNCHGT